MQPATGLGGKSMQIVCAGLLIREQCLVLYIEVAVSTIQKVLK